MPGLEDPIRTLVLVQVQQEAWKDVSWLTLLPGHGVKNGCRNWPMWK